MCTWPDISAPTLFGCVAWHGTLYRHKNRIAVASWRQVVCVGGGGQHFFFFFVVVDGDFFFFVLVFCRGRSGAFNTTISEEVPPHLLFGVVKITNSYVKQNSST